MNTIYASFTDPALAEKAAGSLLDNGVRAEDISLVHHEPVAENTVGAPMTAEEARRLGIHETEMPMSTRSGIIGNTETVQTTSTTEIPSTYSRSTELEEPEDLHAKTGISTTTPGDAGSGAVKGAAFGLGVGLVGALAAIAIPGFGLVMGGGALAIALAGAAATTGAGAIAGGVTGFLKDQGIEEHIAKTYGEAVQAGGTMMAVQVPSGDVDEARAQQILEKYGALNVHVHSGVRSGAKLI